MKGQSKSITMQPTKKGPFKHYQLQIDYGKGVSGTVFFNGDTITNFNNSYGQSSNNLNMVNGFIKNGVNEIFLEITSIDQEELEGGYSEDDKITIWFHAVDEAIFPDEETCVLKIRWNPKKDQKNESIKYLFELQN